MARTDGTKKPRMFTVELRSKAALKSALLGEGDREGVLIEGGLGTLVSAGFLEGIVLEVVGSQGVLRVDLRSDEIRGGPRGRRTVSAGGAGA